MIAAVSEVMYQHHTMRTLMTTSAALYPPLVAELTELLGHDVGYRGTETLDIGAHPADRDWFADLAEVQRAAGMTVEQLQAKLQMRGIAVSGLGGRVRACTHLDVTAPMIEEAVAEIRTALAA